MLTEILLYLIVALAISTTLVLLSSKVITEKLVSAGMLPRGFVGLIPALQNTIRVFAVLMVCGGLLGICIANGWINPETIHKFGLPVTLVLVGLLLLFMTSKKSTG